MKKIIISLVIIILFAIGAYYVFENYYPYDIDYKKELLNSGANAEYSLKNMKLILGEKELTKVIKRYDKHPEKYMADIDEVGDQRGIENLTYRIRLHYHTVYSGGKLTPEEILNQAAEYADKVKAKYPFEKYPMIVAFTDFYNTEGCIEAIDILQKNPEKYKNIRFVTGLEASVNVKMPSQREKKNMDILALCINPYEWPFHKLASNHQKIKEIQDDNLIFLNNYKDFIKRINALKYGITVIAHPLRRFDNDETTDKVINQLFNEYFQLETTKPLFVEGFYPAKGFPIDQNLYNIGEEKAKKYGLCRIYYQDNYDYVKSLKK